MCYSILVKQDLEFLLREFGATPSHTEFSQFETLKQKWPKKIKDMAEHPRIYPGYYATVLVSTKEGLKAVPMRYRLRPHWAEEEIPSKYNVFNARTDSLETRKSWKSIFMQRHGLLVFDRFFEWVFDKKTGKKKVVAFKPNNQPYMWAPVLWDEWKVNDEGKLPNLFGDDSPSKESEKFSPKRILSFAVVTRDPPREVVENGHDRCPAFIARSQIENWLTPSRTDKTSIYRLLDSREPTTFECLTADA